MMINLLISVGSARLFLLTVWAAYAEGDTLLTNPLKTPQESAADFAALLQALQYDDGKKFQGVDAYEGLLRTLQNMERQHKRAEVHDTPSTSSVTETAGGVQNMPEIRLVVSPKVESDKGESEQRMKAVMTNLDSVYGPKFAQESSVLGHELNRLLRLEQAKSNAYMNLEKPEVDNFISQLQGYNPYEDSFTFMKGQQTSFSQTNPFNPDGTNKFIFEVMRQIQEAQNFHNLNRILAEVTLHAEEIVEASNKCKKMRSFTDFLDKELRHLPKSSPVTEAGRRLQQAVCQVMTPDSLRNLIQDEDGTDSCYVPALYGPPKPTAQPEQSLLTEQSLPATLTTATNPAPMKPAAPNADPISKEAARYSAKQRNEREKRELLCENI